METKRYRVRYSASRPQYSDVNGFLRTNDNQPLRTRPLSVRPSQVVPISPKNTPASLSTVPTTSPSQPAKPDDSWVDSFPNDELPPLQSRQQYYDSRKRSRQKRIRRKVMASVLLIIFLPLLGVGGFLTFRAVHTVDKVFRGNILSDATAAFNEKPLNGESTGRVNILLAGDSADELNHGGADLTDSILILSIDTQNHSAFLLSIPRDLWVDIPGYGWQKINAANNGLGTNFPGYPKNGMGQLEHVITTDLGIPIDYYALSDYGAFRDAVDAVGGVTVDIQSPDPRGLYDAFTNLKLPNGEDFLNGQEALNLARARGDGAAGDVSYGFPQTDFDRTMHQRQLFTAIAQKAATLGFLDNPVKISDLMSAFGNNIETDLTLQNVLRLVQITKNINLSSIQSYAYCATLTPGCSPTILTDYTDPASGEEALVPMAGVGNYGQMQQYYETLTSNNPVVREGASVVLLNASDVVGLAKRQQAILENDGFNVTTTTDANNVHPTTMIVDNSAGQKPSSLKLLQTLYPGATVTSDTGSAEAEEAQGYTADFVVILGQNWDSAQQP